MGSIMRISRLNSARIFLILILYADFVRFELFLAPTHCFARVCNIGECANWAPLKHAFVTEYLRPQFAIMFTW